MWAYGEGVDMCERERGECLMIREVPAYWF